jgi:hypothetical protein
MNHVRLSLLVSAPFCASIAAFLMLGTSGPASVTDAEAKTLWGGDCAHYNAIINGACTTQQANNCSYAITSCAGECGYSCVKAPLLDTSGNMNMKDVHTADCDPEVESNCTYAAFFCYCDPMNTHPGICLAKTYAVVGDCMIGEYRTRRTDRYLATR